MVKSFEVAKYWVIFIAVGGSLILSSCGSDTKSATDAPQSRAPLTVFSQEITSSTHDFQIKTGETQPIEVTVKNTGTQPWLGGKEPMAVDVSYRWFDSGENLLPIEGNRAIFGRPVLQPGQTDTLRLPVTAPPNPGSYTLRISMVQEGVAWFYAQGANALVLHVKVS